MLIQKGNAFEFKVGGPTSSWTVPTDPNAAIYNQWAEKNRFQRGHTLYRYTCFYIMGAVFVYDADQDSVLHVTKDDYTNYNTAAPLEKYTDGHTVFKLNKSDPYYFISGVAKNLQKNEKFIVVVMADRSRHNFNEAVLSPLPLSSAEVPPPPLSPALAGEETPSPPSGWEINPTPAPSEESYPPKNGASSTTASVAGTFAAFLCSSVVLAI